MKYTASKLPANIHPEARIGKNVIIEPFSTVYKDVIIGDGSWVGPNAVIMDGARIGKNCKIFPGAIISAIPQDLKFKGEETTAEISDNTVIREYVTLHRGTEANHKTTVGSNCLIMANVHIAHDCMVGNHCVIAGGSGLAGHVTIDDYAILEGWVGVQQFVRIGTHAFISGGSGVRKNVPPFVRAARDPLCYMGINSIGLRRRGFSEETISHIEEIYRMLYLRTNNITQALSVIELEFPATPEKQIITKFIRESTKGIIRGPYLSNEYSA
ncbi:MAG: acyl-ACP--UDP-N-acetylglucosamine O-acyltransferase [Bacteroidetes bacterium]|nr:acyl-ACP--UDP-N-acetylglucosamine O-acyltransferase [Bacteroidota bacterium]